VIKRGYAGAKVRGQAKKDVFFEGRGVFSLDWPFNGCPLCFIEKVDRIYSSLSTTSHIYSFAMKTGHLETLLTFVQKILDKI